jgi:hypothetical protein
MPTYEVWLEELKVTPKLKFIAKSPEEAFAAYKAKWDAGEIPGDFLKTATWKAFEIWRIHK